MRYSFFLLAFILMGISLLEMSCGNQASEQTSTETDPMDTVCAADFVTVPDSLAQQDSLRYAEYIEKATIPAGYNITNPRVNYFVIPINNIDTLIKWKAEGKIMPSVNENDFTWMMLALETNLQTKQQTIVPYFACFTSLGNGEKGSIVYYNLSDSAKIDTVPSIEAEANLKLMKGYIDSLTKDGLLFYPYGFQFPWNDLVGLTCSLGGTKPNNNLNGVLVIKNKNEVDYYLHSFHERKFTKLSKRRDDDDDDEYFDFTSPCPTSCIP